MEIRLPRDTRSPREARQLVMEVLGGSAFPEQAVEDAMLLVSELVTNAIMYGGGEVRLACHVDGEVARIGVSDEDGTHIDAHREQPAVDEITGRGLLIVDRLAARWGIDVAESGKTVWFEIVR